MNTLETKLAALGKTAIKYNAQPHADKALGSKIELSTISDFENDVDQAIKMDDLMEKKSAESTKEAKKVDELQDQLNKQKDKAQSAWDDSKKSIANAREMVVKANASFKIIEKAASNIGITADSLVNTNRFEALKRKYSI